MTTTAQEIKALKKEMQHLADSFEKSVNLQRNGHHVGLDFDTENIRNAAHRAGTNVRSFMKHQSARAGELRDQTEESIHAHPFRSLAMGVAGGLILGALLSRRV